MYQIVMPHENKDIKKINISQAAQSFSIFQPFYDGLSHPS